MDQEEHKEYGRRRSGSVIGRGNTEAVSPVIAIVVIVAIMVVLAAVLYVWAQSFAGDQSSATMGYQNQEVPAKPTDLHIEARMDVEHIRVDGDMVPTYTLTYYGRYVYERMSHATTAILPLPDTTIENIWVVLNGVEIDNYLIASDEIRIGLQRNISNEVEISYRLQGAEEYYHDVPKGRVIDSFYMKLTIDGIDERSALDPDSLNPDSTVRKGGEITYTWDKKRSILRDDITIILPEEQDPYEMYALFLTLMVGLTILFLIFYQSAITRLGREVTAEDLTMLIIPFILLGVGVGLFLVGGSVGLAVAMAMGLFIVMDYLFVFKIYRFKAGVEMFSIPLLFAGAASSYSFMTGPIRTMMTGVLIVFAILIYIIFSVRYKAILKPNETPVILKKRLLRQKEKRELEQEAFVRKWNESESRWNDIVADNEVEIGKLKGTITDLKEKNIKELFAKRHCPYCSDDIDTGFTFCPSCGKDVSIIVKCSHCGGLMDSNYTHCPNCGDRNVYHIEEAEEVPQTPPS